ARMIFSGLEHMDEVPFKTVFFHGLIRDAQGRKMSKSLGNGVDPLDIIDVYGADALRFTLVTGNSPGNDMRFSEEKVSASRNFANKIWNAARFILMNIEGKDIDCALPETLYTSDKWILNRFNNVTAAVTENLEKFELGMAVSKLYDFIWDDFCDWYIELAKIRMNGADEQSADSARRVLVWVMSHTLALLHPFMPYITEEIWQTLPHEGEALIVAKWPEYDSALAFPQEAADMEKVMAVIRAIRVRRNEMNVPPSKKAHIYIETAQPAPYEEGREFIARLAYGSNVEIGAGFTVNGAVTAVTDDAKALLPMDDLVDKAAEVARLTKELQNAQKQLDGVNAKLANEKFISKAPQNVIDGVKANGEKLSAKIKLILETLESYK
ncbi:MAG: class I tRNA ligase family protein, partial [Ruminococcus bromii]|nr:class I tRNA ligase family protein [Ruminococcus bromii]